MAHESAIAIHVPEYADLLDRWRVPTVPVAALGVPPHITLFYPWRPAPLRAADIVAASAALSGFRPFEVTFRSLGRFPGVLYLRPEPDGDLLALIRRLTDAFPELQPYSGEHAELVPHLTVARADTEGEVDRLEAEVHEHLAPHLPLVLAVDKVTVMEQGDDGRWTVRATIGLREGRYPQPHTAARH